MAITEADLAERARALPKGDGTPEGTSLDAADVLGFDQILLGAGSNLPNIVRGSVTGLADETTEELPHTSDGEVILSPDQLKAIVNRAALTGAAALGSAVGQELLDSRALEALYADEE